MAYREVEFWLHSFLNVELDGGELSALPRGKDPPVPIEKEAG
jgi:hypothetical protein